MSALGVRPSGRQEGAETIPAALAVASRQSTMVRPAATAPAGARRDLPPRTGRSIHFVPAGANTRSGGGIPGSEPKPFRDPMPDPIVLPPSLSDLLHQREWLARLA